MSGALQALPQTNRLPLSVEELAAALIGTGGRKSLALLREVAEAPTLPPGVRIAARRILRDAGHVKRRAVK